MEENITLELKEKLEEVVEGKTIAVLSIILSLIGVYFFGLGLL